MEAKSATMNKGMEETQMYTAQEYPKTEEEIMDFFTANMPLFYKIASEYKGAEEFDDLVQLAMIGFMKGLQTFDPEKGTKFTTYCYKCAKNEINMYIRSLYAKARQGVTVSIDAIRENGKSYLDNDLSIYDPLSEPESIETQIYDEDLFRFAMKIINKKMLPVQRACIWGFINNIPQSVTAKSLNISQSEVSKVLKNAICELRIKLKEQGIMAD